MPALAAAVGIDGLEHVSVTVLDEASAVGSAPAISVLPDSGGPMWTALAGGLLLVIGGILARGTIRR